MEKENVTDAFTTGTTVDEEILAKAKAAFAEWNPSDEMLEELSNGRDTETEEAKGKELEDKLRTIAPDAVILAHAREEFEAWNKEGRPLEELTKAGGFSDSKLVDFTLISPNRNSPRAYAIDRITPHCVVGQCSVEALGYLFYQEVRQASSTYGIGFDARVALYCHEKDRPWTSSSFENDSRAVTIECASDNYNPYAFNAIVYEKLITLCTDICKRNGKKKLLWKGTANYQPKSDEMLLTVHRWFAQTICPGDWLMARMGDLAARVTKNLGGDTPAPKPGEKQVSCRAYDATKKTWLPIVTSGSKATDTIGMPGDTVGGVAVHCADQKIRYAVHVKGGKWLPEVTGYNTKKPENGYAGNEKPIDGLIIFGKGIKYKVKTKTEQTWLGTVKSDKANYKDSVNGFAGILGKEIDEIKIWRY